MNTSFVKFVKDECSNYNKHYQTYLDDKPCKVLAGQRCGYFEQAVLGPADYKYRLPDYDYAKLFAQYAEATGKTESEIVSQRLCDCGNPLKPRQRFCDSCSLKKRKQAYRNYRQRRPVDAPQLTEIAP